MLDPSVRFFLCCLQLHRGAVPGEPGSGLLHVELVAEPPGSAHHDHVLSHYYLPQAALHQEVHLKLCCC